MRALLLLLLIPSISSLSTPPTPNKRNLFQQSLVAKKLELTTLLVNRVGTSEVKDAIESKLNFFTHINPLSTTTDSNLLDGLWTLCYTIHPPSSSSSSTPQLRYGHRPFPGTGQEIEFGLEDEGGAWVCRGGGIAGVVGWEGTGEVLGISRTKVTSDKAYEVRERSLRAKRQIL